MASRILFFRAIGKVLAEHGPDAGFHILSGVFLLLAGKAPAGAQEAYDKIKAGNDATFVADATALLTDLVGSTPST